MITCIEPDWPLVQYVGSCVTTRFGGESQAPWNEFNLAAHVGDDPAAVIANRAILNSYLTCKHSVAWVEQFHSSRVFKLEQYQPPSETAVLSLDNSATADAIYTQLVEQPIAVLTADCLPILISSGKGEEIASVHAGWRGLVNGVVEASIACFQTVPSELYVWLGPAIGVRSYEVDDAVIEPLLLKNKQYEVALDYSDSAHEKSAHLNLYRLAEVILRSLGVCNIYGGKYCVYKDERFYSYRKVKETGRMATVIWRRSA